MNKGMTHDELVQYGKRVFNFHPDEQINGAEELLEAARKGMPGRYYDRAAAIFAGYLARYADHPQ